MAKARQYAIEEAKDIVSRLAIILKTSQTYSPDNETVVKVIGGFMTVVRPFLLSGDGVKIEVMGDYFYFNEARIRYSAQYYLNFDFLINEFKKRDVGSITFSGDLSERDLREFIRAFFSCLSSDVPFVRLKDDIGIISSIDIGRPKKVRADGLSDSRRMLKKNYFNAVSHLQSIVTKIQADQPVEVKKTRFAVNTLIDLMLQDVQMLLSMTAIKDYDEYSYYHSVNVSILSVALGMKLGLNKKRLSELGVAAFLHDAGKLNIPEEILNKITPLTDNELEIIKSHPAEGVKTILGSMKIDPLAIICAIVSFEHHLNYDRSGYPSMSSAPELELYSNIITIADRYDAMTSTKVYEPVPKSPEVALRLLEQSAGSGVDPSLLKVFIRMTGIYPIGTMVMLDTGEMGVVCRGNAEFPDRPKVSLIYDSRGMTGELTIVDLAEKGPGGSFHRTIRKSVDALKYGIKVSGYLAEVNA
jgi:HD-GYP domain-containing protein (c-di-GMP phosphodiesterase class II)